MSCSAGDSWNVMKMPQNNRIKIVVIEDDWMYAETLCDAIQHMDRNSEVLVFKSEFEFLGALDALEAAPPTAVVVDMMFPWADVGDSNAGPPPESEDSFRTAGVRCVKAAMARPSLGKVPFIFHSMLSATYIEREFGRCPSNVVCLGKGEPIGKLIHTMRSFISGPVNHAQSLASKDIFIVHGHDDEAKETVARFIEKLGGRAVILHEQPNAGRTIIEKFEHHANVGFAIVLLTPDDVGGRDIKSLRQRARQNVVFELGFFFAKLGRNKVFALHKEEVEIPSDIQGVIYTLMDKGGAWRMTIMRELKAAGILLDFDKAI